MFTKYPSPAAAVKSEVFTACQEVPPPIYVLILDAATFLFVPPAPSSTINKSASTKSAPISVPPSISIAAKGKVPVSPLPIIFPVALGKVNTAELPTECAGLFT